MDAVSDTYTFFKNVCQNDLHKMINIIEGRSNITSRILDWFVDVNVNDMNMFDISASYESTLKLLYGKRHFDPFKRLDRLNYKIYNKW